MLKKWHELMWFLKPRIYECRDCFLVMWMDSEYIIKKKHEGFKW